jgi:hypothetical protein
MNQRQPSTSPTVTDRHPLSPRTTHKNRLMRVNLVAQTAGSHRAELDVLRPVTPAAQRPCQRFGLAGCWANSRRARAIAATGPAAAPPGDQWLRRSGQPRGPGFTSGPRGAAPRPRLPAAMRRTSQTTLAIPCFGTVRNAADRVFLECYGAGASVRPARPHGGLPSLAVQLIAGHGAGAGGGAAAGTIRMPPGT